MYHVMLFLTIPYDSSSSGVSTRLRHFEYIWRKAEIFLSLSLTVMLRIGHYLLCHHITSEAGTRSVLFWMKKMKMKSVDTKSPGQKAVAFSMTLVLVLKQAWNARAFVGIQSSGASTRILIKDQASSFVGTHSSVPLFVASSSESSGSSSQLDGMANAYQNMTIPAPISTASIVENFNDDTTLAELKALLEQQRALTKEKHHFEKDEYWAEVNKHVTEATTIPPESFRSPDFYNVEQDKLFAKTWQVVAYSDQLRNVGDTATATTAGQPVLLTKDRSGEIRAFYNVCRHRGARLVRDDECTGKAKKKCFACPYHNWGYALDGRLIGTPLWNKEMKMSDEELDERLKAAFSTEDVKNFDKTEYGLLPIRVEVWGPFVYVNISGDAPPLKEYLGRCTDDLALYPFDKLVTVRKSKVDVKANWKLLAENFLDYYHVPTVHPGYCDVSRVDDHDRSQGDGMYMCHVTYPLSNGGSALDLDRFPTMKELEGTKHATTGWFHLHFPNMFYFLLPHSMFVVIIEPTSPTTSTEHVRLLVHEDDLNETEEKEAQEAIQAMWEAYSKVNAEDFEICEECQVGINARQFTGGRMAWTFEESLNRFHKLVANCMTGRPHEIPKADVIVSKYDKIPVYNEDKNGIN